MYAIIILGMVLTAIFVAKLPSIYRSSAVFNVEPPNTTREIDNTVFNSYVDQRIQEIGQNVMSPVKLMNIISKYALYTKNGEIKKSTDSLLKLIRDDIKIKRVSGELFDVPPRGSTRKTIVLSVSYESTKPTLAQLITNELALLVLNENLATRMRLGNTSPEFLNSEIDRFKKLISNLKIDLAQYKQDNVESNTKLIGLNQKLKESTERNLEGIRDRMNSLKEQKFYISTKLSEIRQQNNLSSMSEKADSNLNVAQRLNNLQIKADKLLNQFGETFPELKIMREEITALRMKMGEFDNTIELEKRLETARTELVIYQQRYDDGHPDIIRLKQNIISTEAAIDHSRADKNLGANKDVSSTSNNQETIKLKYRLQDVNSEINTLVATKAGYNAKLIAYERSITQLSQSVHRFLEIAKGYEKALKIYQGLEERLNQQNLSAGVVAESKSTKINLIEPPQLPLIPVKPNRIVLLMIGALLSVISGIIAVFIRERFDDSVKGSDDLIQIVGLETIGEISYIKAGAEIS